LIPRKELEEPETTDQKVGGVAKIMSGHLRRMVKACSETGAVAIYINQLREKIGVMYGNPETTPGGRALRFYSSVRIDTRIKEQLKDKDGEVIGVRIKAKTVKNKVAAPYRTGEYNLMFGRGIDKLGDLVDTCIEAGIIEQSGAWYKFLDQKIQSRSKVIEYVREHSEVEKILTDTLWATT